MLDQDLHRSRDMEHVKRYSATSIYHSRRKKSEQQGLQDVQRMAEYVNEPPRIAEGIFHSLLTSDSLDYFCRLLYFPGGPRRYHGTQKKAIESPSFRYEQNNLCFLHTDAVFFKTINMVGGRRPLLLCMNHSYVSARQQRLALAFHLSALPQRYVGGRRELSSAPCMP
jgi:hypothetical protein